MSTTIILAVLFVAILVLRVGLYALCLRLGLRWAKATDVTLRRVFLASTLIFILELIIAGIFGLVSPASVPVALLWAGLYLALILLVPWWIIARFFSITLFRSVQAWLPTLLVSAGLLLVSLFVIRPFFFEALFAATNDMAPTLLGPHWQSTCPQCGQPNYCSAADGPFASEESPQMICDNYHVRQIAGVEHTVHPADHFLVAKFVPPRRWDVVVFRFPEDPSMLYVKRLVGLPGEKIHIEDGGVWVNGKRLEVPEHLKGMEHVSQLSGWPEQLWGSPERPAQLGDDEYFVLGDFSANSMDSRGWRHGAAGHNPFAVPGSHLRGVVTHIFWPLNRWKVLP